MCQFQGGMASLAENKNQSRPEIIRAGFFAYKIIYIIYVYYIWRERLCPLENGKYMSRSEIIHAGFKSPVLY